MDTLNEILNTFLTVILLCPSQFLFNLSVSLLLSTCTSHNFTKFWSFCWQIYGGRGHIQDILYNLTKTNWKVDNLSIDISHDTSGMLVKFMHLTCDLWWQDTWQDTNFGFSGKFPVFLGWQNHDVNTSGKSILEKKTWHNYVLNSIWVKNLNL